MLLETGSGVLVDVESFVRAQYGYDVRCEVVGETGRGDVKLGLKIGFLNDYKGDALGLALRGFVKIPTADEDLGLGTATEGAAHGLAHPLFTAWFQLFRTAQIHVGRSGHGSSWVARMRSPML